MKLVTAILCFVFGSGLCGTSSQEVRPAVLVIPAAVHVNEAVAADVEFTWREDTPLVLDTWSLKGGSVFGDLTVYEESGREVPGTYPLSIPLMPDGKRVVKKGETVRMHLYTMGYTVVSSPGRYYAVAHFGSSFRDETPIRFTTGKRRFDVLRK